MFFLFLSKDVVIAKIDGVENDVESVEINGFPTLKMFKKDKQIVDYMGKYSYSFMSITSHRPHF